MDVEAKVAAARKRYAALEEQLAQLRIDVALARHELELWEQELGRERGSAPPRSLTDRVYAVLEKAPSAMSPSAIAEVLSTDEAKVEPRDVRGTLAHLKRSGRVHNPQHGLWVALPD